MAAAAEPFVCALPTFVLNTAAYSGEIVRGGILAVPRGEIEAARACGMSMLKCYWLVILPRAFRSAFRPIRTRSSSCSRAPRWPRPSR